jgi:hypothetical protein
MDGNEVFVPKTLNYVVKIWGNSNSDVWVSPYHEYGNAQTGDDFSNQTESDKYLRNHFAAIKSLGFNSIRICGLAIGNFKRIEDQVIRDGFVFHYTKHNVAEYYPSMNEMESENTRLIKHVLSIAEESNLKVILLVGVNDWLEDDSDRFLNNLTSELGNDSRILAYDLMNEPYTYGGLGQTKSSTPDQVNRVTTDWYNIIHSNSTNLVTIGGYFNPADAWEPGVTKVDFYSVHQYPSNDPIINQNFSYLCELYKNNYYWAHNSMKIPWMIGETGIRSNTYSTEQKQQEFAKLSQQILVDFGGIGYSWWDYHDCWEADATHGLVRKNVATNHFDINDLKPAGYEFTKEYKKSGIEIPDYYYRDQGDCLNSAYGKVVGSLNKKPLSDVMVLAYNVKTINGANVTSVVGSTYTDYNGSFEVCNYKSNDLISYIRIGHYGSIKKNVSANGVQNLGTIELEYCNGIDANYDINSTADLRNDLPAGIKDIHDLTINSSALNGKHSISATNSINIKNTTITYGTSVKFELAPICPDCSFTTRKSANNQNIISNVKKIENSYLSLFPNPTTGIINLGLNSNKQYNYSIMSVNGIVVKKSIGNSGSSLVDLSDQPSGIYFILIQSEDREITRKKIIKM